MMNYFLSRTDIQYIPKILELLNDLKNRISVQDYSDSYKEYNHSEKLFDSLRVYSIEIGDELLANSQYVFKCYFRFFANLSSYFKKLTEQRYKESWIKLQDCIDCSANFGSYVPINQRYELDDFNDLLYEYEKLYPYNMFSSMEYIIKESECSICGKSFLDLNCPHIKGNLYWGECACEVVTDIETIQAIAIVSHPKDKRCVLEIKNETITEVEKFKTLHTIFPNFECHLQKFRTEKDVLKKKNDKINKQGRNELCSCGSGRKFKNCCLEDMYYDHWHFRVTIKNEIPLLYF